MPRQLQNKAYSFISIDTTLQASRYRMIAWWCSGVLLAGIIGLLALPIGYRVALWILLVVCMVVNQLASRQLIAISCLPSQHSRQTSNKTGLLKDIEWQLQYVQGYVLTPFGQATDIYQAKLIAVHDIGIVAVLEFWVFEPLEQSVKLLIWQDQVSADIWRQFKVLARY